MLVRKSMLSYIYRLIYLSLLAIPMVGYAQRVHIQAQLDRGEIRTGEQASVDVVIRTDDLEHTKFYLMEDTRAGEPFVVLSFLPIDTVEIDEHLREITARMVITSFDSTLVTIPPIMVETPGASATSEPLALRVVQPEVDAQHPEQFKPLKSLWVLDATLMDYLRLILRSYLFWGIVALLILGYLYYRYVYKRARVPKSRPAPVEPVRTPGERALIALDRLSSVTLVEQEDFKTYYTDLVDILKGYADEMRAFGFAECTTAQILDLLQRDEHSTALLSLIRQILRDADMSKFAKGTMLPSEAMQSLTMARQFVETADQIWQSTSDDDPIKSE